MFNQTEYNNVVVAAVEAGEDPHTAGAMFVFGHQEPSKVTPEERRAAKLLNLGIIYSLADPGIGARIFKKQGFTQSVDIERQLATVRDLTKPGQVLMQEMTPEKLNVWHAATGVTTEGGEIMTTVKKHVIYNQPLDIKNIVEEVGDVLFYLQQLCDAIQLPIEEAMRRNVTKLRTRYPDGYSNEAATLRADKVPGE